MNKINKNNLILITIVFSVLVLFMLAKYYSGIDNSYYDKVSNLNALIFNIGYNNIYYYMYLGLFNISTFIIMILSFINAKYLVLGINIINLFISVLLFYKLLKNNKFNYNICLYGTIIFIISYLPNIFNEVIYLNYLPFLILGILSIDKNDKKLFIFSIVMIGFTNYKFLLLSNIIFLFYYYYKNNTKNILKFILLLVISNAFLSFIYLPILLYNYEGYIFNCKNEINLLVIFSVIMLIFDKKEKLLLLLLILSLILNYVLKTNISLFYPFYIFAICIMLKNIYEYKIKMETIYKIFVCLFITVILFDKDSINYINFLLSFVIVLLLNKDNKLSILILVIYFILYGTINYSSKYITDKDAYNYINYNSFNIKSYNKYSFPYSDELSLKYVIVNDSDNYDYTSDLKKFYINNSNIIYVSKEVNHINNEYKGSGKIIIDTSSIKDKILIIKSNNESIKINNNELENQKYIFINNNNKLEITFLNNFNYSDIECYYMDNNIDINKLSDNTKFEVNIEKEGYIVFKYKYDKFINIYIDNKKVSYYKVNNDLVGVKVNKGKHSIEVRYFSYYKLISFIISILSIIAYKYLYKKNINL